MRYNQGFYSVGGSARSVCGSERVSVWNGYELSKVLNRSCWGWMRAEWEWFSVRLGGELICL